MCTRRAASPLPPALSPTNSCFYLLSRKSSWQLRLRRTSLTIWASSTWSPGRGMPRHTPLPAGCCRASVCVSYLRFALTPAKKPFDGIDFCFLPRVGKCALPVTASKCFSWPITACLFLKCAFKDKCAAGRRRRHDRGGGEERCREEWLTTERLRGERHETRTQNDQEKSSCQAKCSNQPSSWQESAPREAEPGLWGRGWVGGEAGNERQTEQPSASPLSLRSSPRLDGATVKPCPQMLPGNYRSSAASGWQEGTRLDESTKHSAFK